MLCCNFHIQFSAKLKLYDLFEEKEYPDVPLAVRLESINEITVCHGVPLYAWHSVSL